MRSLFIRIFLSFLLITLLASITTAAISYLAQVGPYGELKNRLQRYQYQSIVHTLSVAGIAAVKILETGNEQDLVSYFHAIEQSGNNHIFFLKTGKNTISGRPLPADADNLANLALQSDAIQYTISETNMVVAMPLKIRNGQDTAIIGTIARILLPPAFPQQEDSEGFLQPPSFHFPLGLPLIVVVLVAASGCYLLARSLTAPVRRLRTAVQKMTKGDFSARIIIPLRRNDELADLTRDFNAMAEQIATLLKSQKRLLRDISHELRSPLTRMNVSLELARKQPDNAEQYLLRIAKESERINDLIDQLLTLTRLEGDADYTQMKPVNIPELIKDIVDDANYEAAHINRTVTVRRLTKVLVPGSREMLGRALENVIRNGLYYTADDTTVEIDIEQGRDHTIISIKDHGPGVPDKNLDQIFKPFFRVAESRNRDSGGSGIGLAIAKQAVLMHGGDIKADNNPAGGLIITIRLPIV